MTYGGRDYDVEVVWRDRDLYVVLLPPHNAGRYNRNLCRCARCRRAATEAHRRQVRARRERRLEESA